MAFKPVPNSYYYLVAVHSGKVLEVADQSDKDGAVIRQGDPQPFSSSTHQQWTFNPTRVERVYVLRARHSQKVIDIAAASTDDGAAVQQWEWHGVDQEAFHVIDAGDGTFYLQALHSGKVLDVYGADMAAGKPVVQFHNHYNGKNLHQRFRPVLAEQGVMPGLLPGFTNPSQTMRDGTMVIASLVPQVGGAVRSLVNLFWPDQGPAMIWNQVMRYIETYVESRLLQDRIEKLRDAIDGASQNLRDFTSLLPGNEKATKLTATLTALNAVDRQFLRAVTPEQTVSYLVTIGTIKLTVLQEQARNYAAIAKLETDENQAAHLKSLRDGIAEYTRAAQYFREQAVKARLAQIGSGFHVETDSTGHWDITLRDGADGTETRLRCPAGDRAASDKARELLLTSRKNTVSAQFGGQLDAILAPSRLWQSFDPEKARPVKRTIKAWAGPIGTEVVPIGLSGGKGIRKIELWADGQLRGIRVTNTEGKTEQIGVEMGERSELEVPEGDAIAGCYGSAFHYVHSLILETRYGRRITAGQLHVGYRFHADMPPELNARLAGITASADGNLITSVEFLWEYILEGDYPPAAKVSLDAPLWAPEPIDAPQSKPNDEEAGTQAA